MCLLLESIRWENRVFHNLELHQARMQGAVAANFSIEKKFNLDKAIAVPETLKNKRYKCRILYDTEIREVTFEVYKRKKINSLQLIVDNQISYPHKFVDRECIHRHTKNLKDGVELLFVKNGLLRDASFSNIALYNGEEWHTPNDPLLRGIKRAELLSKKKIIAKKLLPEDLTNYRRISFINALNDLDELSLDL